MKRKRIAILLAALLSVSPIAESAAVWGAEFSAGETSAETTEFDLNMMESGAAESAESALTDNWTAGEDGTDETYETEEAVEFTTGEETQEDLFIAEEPDILTQAAQAEQGHGTYEIAYVTQEQYQRCLEGEGRPDVDYERLEDTTLTEALKALKGQNTGYCVVVPSDLEGFEDLVIPEGLTVFVAYEQDLNIRSITPNGNLTLWGIGETEDTLEIKAGNGTVTFKDCHIDATLKGTGADDTVVFYSDCTMGAIKGIENIHFGRECWGVNVREASEFYDLYNDTGRTDTSVPVSIRIEGYQNAKIPVFHKEFDWGVGDFSDEQGNTWTCNYALGIAYIDSFDEEEWTEMDIHSGGQAVRTTMSDAEFLKTCQRMYVAIGDYSIDIDGRCFHEEDVFRVFRYQDAGGMTAQEIFESHGVWDTEYPDNADEYVMFAADADQISRILAADHENSGAAYYTVDLLKHTDVGTITIPSGVKGVKFWGPSDYDEATDTTTNDWVKIPNIKTQAGQTIAVAGSYIKGAVNVSGDGTVIMQDCEITGVVNGAGRNDHVVFMNWNRIGGLSGVENVYFGKRSDGLELTGASEFYNLYCDDKFDANDMYPVSLRVLGKDESKAPVFHKAFDWGRNTFTDEEGNSWEDNYKLAIQYFKTFEGSEEDTRYDVGGGFQAVKFDMADTDIIDMMNRVEVHVPDHGYAVFMDGRTQDQEAYVINIQRFQDCEGMSAEEAFEALGKSDLPDGSMEWLVSLPDTEQAYRYMTADQKKYNTEGYYFVRLGTDAKVNGALTVPNGVKGIKYAGASDYNEETDTVTLLPSATFSTVNVPAGKKLTLMELLVKADTITFSGAGTTELLDARLNAKVTADSLEISRAVVKTLDCKELLTEENGQLVVKDYLSFEKAQIDPSFSIYAEPTSYLRLGEIDSEGYGEGDIQIFTGQDASSSAGIYFAGNLNLGRYTFTNDEGESVTANRKVCLVSCDEKKAKKVNASFTEDCFSGTYHYTDEENSWWGNYLVGYEKQAICLASVDKKLNEKAILSSVIAEYVFSDTNVWIGLEPRLDEDGEWESGAVNDNKRYTSYWMNRKQVNAKAYYVIANASATSIESAKVSSIKTQVYAGKAVEPSVTVTLNGKKLKSGTDYTVSYTNNKKAGVTATATITGKGNYIGTVSKTFKIAAIPAKGKVYTVGDLKYKVTKSAYKNGTVGVYAPVKKTITSVSIPSTVKISGYTFQVTAIGNKAFSGCTKLKKVTIGSKVTTIGKQAFYGCKFLTSITISSKVLKAVGSSALKGISAKAVIKVPSAKLSAYTKLFKNKGQKSSVKIKK